MHNFIMISMMIHVFKKKIILILCYLKYVYISIHFSKNMLHKISIYKFLFPGGVKHYNNTFQLKCKLILTKAVMEYH